MTALVRYSLVAEIAVFLLAGCGGSQSTAPETLPMSGIAPAKAEEHLRTSPATSREDFLYVSQYNGRGVNAYSYPDMNLVGKLTGLTETVMGLCADKHGDIFVTEEGNFSRAHGSYIVEFAHGGTAPIASLKDSDWPSSCSVDPTTGNLAVTNWVSNSVAIYANAQGNPTYISTPLTETDWPAYDSVGNLFVSGHAGSSAYSLIELPSGSTSFMTVSLNESIGLDALQWNDGYLVTSFPNTAGTILDLYRIQISGSTGTIVGTTVLNERKQLKLYYRNFQFSILGHSVLAAGTPHDCLQLWRYPSGGNVRKTLIKQLEPWAIALSVGRSKK